MKIAMLICGQLRDIDFCIESMNDFLINYNLTNNIPDIFISTQNMNCIKPRIDTTNTVNQYIILPITYNIQDKLNKLFGKKLKGLNIRELYTEYIEKQGTDLILKNTLGWAENFKDLDLAINMVLDYEKIHQIKYDLFIKTRPDLIYCDKLCLDNIDINRKNTMYIYDKNDRFIWDTVFYMDRECLMHMKEYYIFYMKFMQDFTKKCTQWNHVYNCEDHLYLFTTLKKITTIDIGRIGFPLTWLIADIKNKIPDLKRYEFILNKRINKKIKEYTDKCKTITFDIKV
jgi:hypothetical protein